MISRKVIVGLLAFAALIVAYLVYTQVGGTPGVELTVPEAPSDPNASGVLTAPDDEVGSVDGFVVGGVERTRFFHTNENQQVDREMGFERLLRDRNQSDQWKITNPYMKLYMPEFRCDVTADRGIFQLETAFGQPMPNDAVFEGNVVIHIVPSEPNDPMESFIYLDDVAFVADKSLFSSSGSVNFISRSASLKGVGLELLYDSLRSRLELFRVVDLESLRLRSDQIGSLSSVTSPDRTAESSADRAVAVRVARTASAQPEAQATDPEPNEPEGEYYQCVFHRNVRIETPEQLILARDRLSINDILWRSSEDKEEDDDETSVSSSADPNEAEEAPTPGPDALDTSASTQLAFDSIPEEFYDIVVTCDGGFVVAPTKAMMTIADPCVAVADASSAQTEDEVPPASGRQQAIAQRIDYDVPTSNTTLTGPVELTFYIDPGDLSGGDSTGASDPVPMNIKAEKSVRFLATSNQIVLEGDCVAFVEQTDADVTYEHRLMAPIFTLVLAVDANDDASQPAVAIERFAAHGGWASLVALKRIGDEIGGWTEFEVARMDYEADRKFFTAYGPGKLLLHNAVAAAPEADPNEFSFDKPCYALLEDFDLLTYTAQTNKIVAEAGVKPILISYVPLENGQSGDAMRADAGHVEIALRQTPEGRTQLSWLTVTDGITYEDQTKQFAGSRLTYDHDRSLMTIFGDETQPCYLNGAHVDEIEWDLETDQLKFQIPGSSTPFREARSED